MVRKGTGDFKKTGNVLFLKVCDVYVTKFFLKPPRIYDIYYFYAPCYS